MLKKIIKMHLVKQDFKLYQYENCFKTENNLQVAKLTMGKEERRKYQ